MNSNQNISARTYEVLHAAFDHFNEELFDGRLPPAILVLHRKRGAHGYFHANQWLLRGEEEGTEEGLHEIALNPQTMGRDAREVLSTLAHEMAHLWDQLYGKVPASGHGPTWANKMDEIGLTPTSTGLPGGKRTGRKMMHMIVAGGPFDIACDTFLGWNPDAVGIFAKTAAPVAKKKDLSKVKHQCPDCNANVWGKLGIKVICGECDQFMAPVGVDSEEDE